MAEALPDTTMADEQYPPETNRPGEYPTEPPSYEASQGDKEAPPLPQKGPLQGGDPCAPVSTIPLPPNTVNYGVITNDMMANFAGCESQDARKRSTQKHQRLLRHTGIWQLLASGILFTLSVIKHVHGHRLYGLFGYASAAAGLLAALAALMTSNRPTKCSIVASVALGGLALAGGTAGIVGNSLVWRCPYLAYGWCIRHREAKTTIGLSLFTAALEIAFAFAQILIASILLCRKESGRMSQPQQQGTAPVNFVLQVTPGPSHEERDQEP